MTHDIQTSKVEGVKIPLQRRLDSNFRVLGSKQIGATTTTSEIEDYYFYSTVIKPIPQFVPSNAMMKPSSSLVAIAAVVLAFATSIVVAQKQLFVSWLIACC